MSSYEQKIKTLKIIKKFELLNRLACYACVIPFIYTTACLGQHKNIPTAVKVGAVGFVGSSVGIFIAKKKEEEIQRKLEKIAEGNKKFRY